MPRYSADYKNLLWDEFYRLYYSRRVGLLTFVLAVIEVVQDFAVDASTDAMTSVRAEDQESK